MQAAEAATRSELQVQNALWLPALVASVLLALEIYALFFDIGNQPKLQRTVLPVIATFQQGVNEVRDRPGGTITWQVPAAGSDLHEQDAILTMTRAQALVRFTDGAELNIEPDSLVVLEKTPYDAAQRYQKIVVRLMQGSFAKQTGGTLPLQVALADTPILIEDATGGALFHLRQNAGQLDVEVESGSLNIGDAKSTRNVDSSQRVTIRAGQVEVHALPVRFSELKPLSGARIGRDEDEHKILVEWKQAVDPGTNDFEPRVMVARQPDMSDPFEAEIVDKQSSPLRAEIEAKTDGPYFWRVQARDGTSKSRTATVYAVTRTVPEVETPDDDFEAIVGQTIQFRWKHVSANVTVEVSKTEDFTNPTRIPQKTGENSAEVHFTENTKLYWRLQADYGPGVGSAHPTDARELMIKAKPMLKAPGKFKSRIRTESSLPIRWLDEIANLFWIRSAVADEMAPRLHKIAIDLEWESVEGASQYRLEISPESNFKTLLLDRNLRQAVFVYNTEQTDMARKLFYRVATIDAAGTQGEFSEAQELEIEALPVPKPVPKAETPAFKRPVVKTAPIPVNTKPAFKPVLLTEEQRKDRERFHLSLSFGAAYHARTFKSLTAPAASVGAGLIPAYASMELSHRLSSATTEADDGGGISFALGAAGLAEQAEPTTAGIVDEKFPIPLLRVWALLEKEVWGAFAGAGAYGSTSQKFSWNGRHAVNQRVALLGVAVMLTTSQVLPRAWHWRAQAGLIGSGGKGADVNMSLKNFFSGTVRLGDHSGLFWEAEIFGRYLDIETSYGGVVKFGYSL